MMRALWTGASGMIAQQTNVDNISNNLANVNTTGFKKSATQFQSLLYAKLQREVTDHNGDPKPVIGQVGAGVKVSGLVTSYKQGPLTETGGEWDMGISGDGFFRLRMYDGSVAYTRDGAFNMSLGGDGVVLSSAEGYEVLGIDGEPITFEEGVDVTKLQMDEFGRFMYPNENGDYVLTGQQISLVQFNNPAGLEKIAGSNMKETVNSGEPRSEIDDENLRMSVIRKGYLEGSNVQTVDEVVNLIVAQRAYEMNSKVITTVDEMLQQANNLRS